MKLRPINFYMGRLEINFTPTEYKALEKYAATKKCSVRELLKNWLIQLIASAKDHADDC